MRKLGQVQLSLTINYHFIYKDSFASYMEAATIMHNFLSILSNQSLFSANINHRYWVVHVYPNNCHYLVFHIPGIGQVQPTRMPQRARTLSFTFNKLMNILL